MLIGLLVLSTTLLCHLMLEDFCKAGASEGVVEGDKTWGWAWVGLWEALRSG